MEYRNKITKMILSDKELHEQVQMLTCIKFFEELIPLKEIAEEFQGSYSETGDYPAWEYRKDSVLRDTMVRIYRQMFEKEPQVVAIHAGLECGLLSEKLPGLDCVSIGPDMQDIHTSRERLNIASTERTWRFILEILKSL